MKQLNAIFTIILVLVFGLIINSCGPTKPTILKQNPAYAEYISGYTSGMLSRKDKIRIELSDFVGDTVNLDEESLPDDALLQDIFSFEPAIEGKAVWINNRTIEFQPNESLPVNQFYNCEFNLEKVAKVKDGLEIFPFQFSTYQQKMYVDIYGLKSNDDYDIEWQYINGTIKTSDEADTATLKQTIKAVQNGKELPVKILESYEENEYNFQIDSVERKKTEGKVLITWNGEAINSYSRGSKEIIVSALGDFTVENSKIIDYGDQSVELMFSEPIQLNQNLKGIITLEGIENPTFKISSNTVTIYVPKRILGNRKLFVSNGIKNSKGYNMLEAYSTDLYFEEPKPLVRIKGSGSILPNSSGLIFPFEAVSLKAVEVRVFKIFENNIHHFLQVNDLDGADGLTRYGKVVAKKKIALNYDKSMNLKQWNQHVIDLGKLIQPDPGAIYRVSIKFNKEDALCDCSSEENEENDNEESSDVGFYEVDPNWNEEAWTEWGYEDGFDTWEYFSEDESPCSDQYYLGKAVSRNILASDLGMIFKVDESKLSHAFINNMITTDPIENAEVQYFDYTKQLIASGKTDENGMLEIKLKEKPFLMVAKYGKQRGYLKLADGYANSLSKFDIEGEQVQKGIKGFIYGERGVWRPGDSLYLTFMLENKDRLLPDNHPVKFELFDPNGQIVQQMTKTNNINGVFDFRTAVNREAPTGNYTAITTVGNKKFTKNIKIETVKPNRLKIYLDMDKTTARDSFASMKVQWLHGAIAKNLKTSVSVSVQMAKTRFDKFSNYEFDSPLRYFASNEESVFDGKLNALGEAKIKTKLNVGNNSPGKLRATYISKVYEESGDFSIDRCTKIYSPFETYIGLQIPKIKTADNTLETGTKYNMNIVALSELGALKKVAKLQVKVYRLEWKWWYEKDEEDLANYMAKNGTLVVQDTTIAALDGKANFPFKIDYPDYGRFLITVTDLEGNHQTGKIISVDWPYLKRGNRTNNENASMLNFTSDFEKYTTGDKIKLSIPSPSNGRALISVETRSKILKKYWISTKKGETIHELEATKDMAPNSFIHITLIQPHANTKNDLPIRMYGVIPIIVDDPLTHISPLIDMKDEIRPESTNKITIHEKDGKGMTYTIAIVDDGLLDLTRFKTPDPWNSFYAREALGIKTWDMYDDVIGAYAGKLDKLLSIGGDGELNYGKGNKANRFKPMVKFIGTFYLAPGESKTHTVAIPNYIGSVRVMVVARNESAYGSAEKTVAVKKPLMVLASLPRVLGPSEVVNLPVNVFAMEKFVKDVKVQIQVNEFFKIDGKPEKSIHFEDIGDDVINFKLSVAKKLGIAKVKIIATSGNETAVDEIEIDIRPSNPVMFESTELVIEPGKEIKSSIAFSGITGTNGATVEFSTLPSFGFEKRLKYLVKYPHGCIEQTTSSVFPQLLAGNIKDIDENVKNKITENIKAGIRRLQRFQTANGGFSYWPGEGMENEWGTNYAGHFMLEAEKKGYKIPLNLKTKWFRFQKEQARNWSSSNNVFTHSKGKDSYQLIQAYRLYVLALGNQAELGAMNRLREEKNISSIAKWRLAAAYELVGQHEVAEKIISKLPTTVEKYRELSYTYGTNTRDQAMIIETLSLMDKKQLATPLVKDLAKALGSEKWMSTNETAFGLLALCEYAGLNGENSTLNYSYNLNATGAVEKTSNKRLQQVKFNENEIKKKTNISFKNLGKSTLFISIITEGIPLESNSSKGSKDLTMSVKYKDSKGEEMSIDKITQGKEFVVEVTLSNPTKRFFREMSLTQIFPSGWEIHNSRMDETSENAGIRYQDIRDDRVNSYYDLPPGETKTIRLKINATYSGKFYMPSFYSEAMYDHSIYAKSAGKWVSVVKEE